MTTQRTPAETKIFILSSTERTYPISYLDGLSEENLNLIAHNIEKNRELEVLKNKK